MYKIQSAAAADSCYFFAKARTADDCKNFFTALMEFPIGAQTKNTAQLSELRDGKWV